MRLPGWHSKLGQTTLELAVTTAAVCAALLAMQVYMKRGISGSLRDSADQVGSQYAPRHTESVITTTETGATFSNTFLTPGGPTGDKIVTATRIDPSNPETTTRSGYENVDALTDHLWE